MPEKSWKDFSLHRMKRNEIFPVSRRKLIKFSVCTCVKLIKKNNDLGAGSDTESPEL